MHARERTHAITKSELLYSFLATVKQFLQRNSNSTAVVRPQLFTRIAKYTSTKAGMTPRDLSRVQWPVQSTRSSHGSKLWKHQAVLSSQLSAWNYDEKTLSLLASEAARSKCNTTVGSSAHCKPMAISVPGSCCHCKLYTETRKIRAESTLQSQHLQGGHTFHRKTYITDLSTLSRTFTTFVQTYSTSTCTMHCQAHKRQHY